MRKIHCVCYLRYWMKAITRFAGLLVIAVGQSCFDTSSNPTWPEPEPEANAANAMGYALFQRSGALHEEESDAALVRDLPVCVASEKWSAGELGRSVLYHVKRVGRQLHVGYFVYWTTERPWGDNLLSYLVLPAAFVDSFYSHFFFVFPGMQRVLHGPADIEGARVVYEQRANGRWAPVSAVADDELHREVTLDPKDFVDAEGRVVLMTDVWSHQLGAKGARAFVEGQRHGVVCYDHESLSLMTGKVADSFRLGSIESPRRACPAWRL
ncbi:MAG TPA: hypothetical protein VGL13_02570 [Polyangiaceae bacterium]